jgi:hypothetical protein
MPMLFLAMTLLCPSGCRREYRDNTGNVSTSLRLKNWGLIIKEEIEHGDGNFAFFGTINDVLEKCKKEKKYSDAELDELLEDYWRQAFTKETWTDGGLHHLRMTSVGRNSILEHGSGDDLVNGKRQITGKIRFIDENGSPDFLPFPSQK